MDFLAMKISSQFMEVPVMADAVLTGVKITPLGDRVLVRPAEKEEARRSGIIIPDTAKEKPQEGKVVSVGPGKVSDEGKTLPMQVKAGDTILFGKYSGTEIKVDDVDHLILHQDDILAIVAPK
jgi:chaperonin GroES